MALKVGRVLYKREGHLGIIKTQDFKDISSNLEALHSLQ
jgi:hypothetical protein